MSARHQTSRTGSRATREERTAALRKPVSLDAIIEASIALLREEGEPGLGFNRVARALGVKPPSLYNYVADGEDLRRRVAIHGWRLFIERCRQALDDQRGVAAFRSFCHLYRDFARQEVGLFDLMASVTLPPNDVEHAQNTRELFGLFAGPLDALNVRPADRIHFVRILRAAVHGFVVLEQHGQFAMSEDVDQTFERMLKLILLEA